MESTNNEEQTNTKSLQKSKFSQEEDQKLIDLVNQYGENNWGTIASKMEGRNIRQCRERWNHYLSPNVSNAPWTEMEDLLLNQKYIEFGPKWKKIAEFFPNRTYINVKNRFLLKKRHTERISSQFVEISKEFAKKMAIRKKTSFNPYFNCIHYTGMDNFTASVNNSPKKVENNTFSSDYSKCQCISPQIDQSIESETFNEDIDDFLIENNPLVESYDEFFFPI